MQYPARLTMATLALAFTALATTTASAMPSAGAGGIAAGESQVIKVHGCHRSCEWGAILRWHRHIGPACRPVGCLPRAPFPNRCWVDWQGIRHCRW